MSKTIKFGKVIPPQTPPPGTARTTDAGSTTQQPASRPPVQRPYSLVFSINTINLLNRTNKGNPVGNMTSPFFLQSPSGSNNFFFSPGGGSGGNRLISLRVRLSF
jgi:hypothetical protein